MLTPTSNTPQALTLNRYHSFSIVLHWAMAVGVLFMLSSGVYMTYADISKADQFQWYQIHKAAGVLVLWAVIARIAVRFLTKSPSQPIGLNHKQLKAAAVGHKVLYLAMVLMPLSGWLMVSASPFGLPTFVFVDWIKWPHIPGLARNTVAENIANTVHWITAISMSVLILGHISAVVWHKVAHNINLMKRMWWHKNEH